MASSDAREAFDVGTILEEQKRDRKNTRGDILCPMCQAQGVSEMFMEGELKAKRGYNAWANVIELPK